MWQPLCFPNDEPTSFSLFYDLKKQVSGTLILTPGTDQHYSMLDYHSPTARSCIIFRHSRNYPMTHQTY